MVLILILNEVQGNHHDDQLAPTSFSLSSLPTSLLSHFFELDKAEETLSSVLVNRIEGCKQKRAKEWEKKQPREWWVWVWVEWRTFLIDYHFDNVFGGHFSTPWVLDFLVTQCVTKWGGKWRFVRQNTVQNHYVKCILKYYEEHFKDSYIIYMENSWAPPSDVVYSSDL